MKAVKERELCGHPVSRDGYPRVKRRRVNAVRLRSWLFWTLLAGASICLLVNLLVGGPLWVLYVLIGEAIFYIAFLAWQPVERSLAQKLTAVGVLVSALLLLAQWFGGGTWASRIVVPFVFFGILCVHALVYVLDGKRRHQHILPLAQMLGVALLAVLIGLQRGAFSWAWTVLLSGSGAMVLLWCILFRKQVLLEIRKKAHR